MNWGTYGEAQRKAAHVEILERLARMRLSLKTAREEERKAAREGDVMGGSHRDLQGTGRYVQPRVQLTDVLSLKRHLTEDHGLNPGYVGSLIGPSLHAVHDRVHHDRGGSDQ
jgi:hypothetical protein